MISLLKITVKNKYYGKGKTTTVTRRDGSLKKEKTISKGNNSFKSTTDPDGVNIYKKEKYKYHKNGEIKKVVKRGKAPDYSKYKAPYPKKDSNGNEIKYDWRERTQNERRIDNRDTKYEYGKNAPKTRKFKVRKKYDNKGNRII